MKTAKQDKLATVKSTAAKTEIATPDAEVVQENEKLSEEQSAELKKYEATIKGYQDKRMEACLALYQIMVQRLYRAEFSKFDDYCRTRWGFGGGYGYRQAKAGKALSNLKLLPFGDTGIIENEAQLRPLASLDKEQLGEAWAAVVKEAAGKPLTAERVAEVVAEVNGDKPAKEKPAKDKGEIKPEVVINKDKATIEVLAAPPTEVAPVVVASVLAPNPPAPKIDTKQILDLLDRVRAQLNEDENAEALRLIDRIEHLISGDEDEIEEEAHGAGDGAGEPEDPEMEVMNR